MLCVWKAKCAISENKMPLNQASHSLSTLWTVCVCMSIYVVIMAETSTTNIIDTFRLRVAIKLDFIVVARARENDVNGIRNDFDTHRITNEDFHSKVSESRQG